MKRPAIIATTLIFLGIVLYNIDWSIIKKTAKDISISHLAIAYIMYLLSFIARAIRWKVFLPDESIYHLFKVVALHTMSNNIYPARTGELSFIYLLKAKYPKSLLTSALIWARLSDMFCISVFFILSAFFTITNIHNAMEYITTTVILLLIITIAFTIAINLFQKIEKLKTTIDAIKTHIKLAPQIVITSVLIWTIKYTSFYFITKSIFKTQSMRINFWQSVFGVSFSELTTVLPIHSIGGIGTFEAGWTGAYVIMGFGKDISINTGVIFHAILLMFSIVTAVACLVKNLKF